MRLLKRAPLLADVLRESPWTRVVFGETEVALICPACGALVAAGAGSERSWREQHIISLHS